MLRPTVFAATLLAAAAASASPGHKPGHGHDERAYGEPGDPRRPARIVQVTMREADGRMTFVPDRIAVRRGEQIRFVLRNRGALDHELVVATLEENLAHAKEMEKFPEMEHDDPNARRLAPGRSGEILWRFTRAGEFDFSCLIPGHREAGMFGTITVK
ncbi:plastocyanin/azurin family copper-binding protein [Stella sp.]|uniref:cupredoxin domain-containing protein n=1 Tax=Stella sp. TaxID=2912054 RepID=UPI0035B4C0DA